MTRKSNFTSLSLRPHHLRPCHGRCLRQLSKAHCRLHLPFSAASAASIYRSAATIPFPAFWIPFSAASKPSLTIGSASCSALLSLFLSSPKSPMSSAPAGSSLNASAAAVAGSSNASCLRLGTAVELITGTGLTTVRAEWLVQLDRRSGKDGTTIVEAAIAQHSSLGRLSLE